MSDLPHGGDHPAPLPTRPPGDRSRLAPLRTVGGALLGWWQATTLDALIVGLLWWLGLWLLHIPWAPLWAFVGALCQFVPGVGAALGLIGPVLALLFTVGKSDDWYRLGYLLGLYALIAVLDGLVIQPYVLHRTTRVPWWAALLGPIVLGILIPFWGVLLAPPLLAVIFAFWQPTSRKPLADQAAGGRRE